MKKISKKVIKKFNNYLQNNRFNYRDSSLPLSFTVNNPTKKPIKVVLFGAVDDNKQSHKYITTEFGVSYSSILKSLLAKPLYIDKIRVQSDNINALQNTATLLSKNIFGQSLSDPYNIWVYMTAQQRNQNLIECYKPFIISENVSFTVNVPAKTHIRYDFNSSKFYKFKSNIEDKSSHSPFGKLIINMLSSADFIIEQFNRNPYLHYNEGMDIYCSNVQCKIYNWIHDNGFDLAFHKNMIEIYDILEPFIERYYKACQEAKPLMLQYEEQKLKEWDEAEEKRIKNSTPIVKKVINKDKVVAKSPKSKVVKKVSVKIVKRKKK